MLIPERVTVSTTCPKCHQETFHSITWNQYQEIRKPRQDRLHIQIIFPERTPIIREQFITGLCPDCQKKVFR